MSIKSIACGFFVMLMLAGCAPSGSGPVPSFDDALTKHLNAVASRDMQSYTDTITMNPNLPLIFPDGSIIATRQEVLDFHTAWFKDPNWVMDHEIVGTLVKGTMAIATVRYQYKDTADGPPRYAFLGLVFALEGGEWRLIHDQNTRIEG